MIYAIGRQGSEQVVIIAAHGFIDYHVNVSLIPAVTSCLLCEAAHKVEGVTVLTNHLVIDLADGVKFSRAIWRTSFLEVVVDMVSSLI